MAISPDLPRISRRGALQLVLGAAVLPLLAACQGGPSAPPTRQGEPAKAVEPTRAPTEVPAPAQAAPASQAKPTEVNIAAMFPTSGELARPGQLTMQAVQMTAELINADGGVKALGGAKINVIPVDTRSDDKVTRTETERIITTSKITAINGAYASAHTLVASEVSERYKVPLITFSIANQLVERGFKYIFQGSARASQMGEAQVKLAGEAAGDQKKIGVVFENTAYGTSTSKGIQDQAQKTGLEIVLFEAYERNFTDAGPLVNKIKASGAQVLFPITYLNDLILIVRTLKQQNVKVPLVAGGTGVLLPDFLRTFGDDAHGVLSVSVWNWDMSEDSKAFNKLHVAKHGEFIHEVAGEASVFMYVLADAIERAASADPEAVREALSKTDLTKGYGAMMPGGRVQFDEKGWNRHVFPLGVQWQKGELVTVYPKEMAKAPIVKPV